MCIESIDLTGADFLNSGALSKSESQTNAGLGMDLSIQSITPPTLRFRVTGAKAGNTAHRVWLSGTPGVMSAGSRSNTLVEIKTAAIPCT